jgi:flagellar hook-associated protein 1 FlgK
MGGLNTSLLVGMQALDATQAALEATSNNIANANTPGYTREIPQFSENQETDSAGQVSGGGVSLDGLQSVRDELLNLQIQQQTSLQSSMDTQSSALQQIQSYFSSSSGDGISSELAAFSTSFPPASRSCPRIRPAPPCSRAFCRQARTLPMLSTPPQTGSPPRSRPPTHR